MKAKYKILDHVSEDYYGKQTPVFKEATLAEVMEAKGIKRLGKSAAAARAARAKLVSAKVFKGVAPTWDRNGKNDHLPVPLEDLAAANDIDGYVKAWRAVNHLTQ